MYIYSCGSTPVVKINSLSMKPVYWNSFDSIPTNNVFHKLNGIILWYGGR